MIKKIYKKNKEIINYIFVGGLTTLVSIGSYALLRLIIQNIYINTTLSWILSVCFAYVMNKKYVFNSKTSKVFKEFMTFASCRLTTLGMEYLFMFILTDILILNDMVSKIIVQFLILLTNYILSKLIVFKK